MNAFITFMDDAPKIVKIIFAIPLLNVVWAAYRIVKGVENKDNTMLVVGIIWVFLGSTILWIVDLVHIILNDRPQLFA